MITINFAKVTGQNLFVMFCQHSGTIALGFKAEGGEGEYFVWFARLSPELGDQVLGAGMVTLLKSKPDEKFQLCYQIMVRGR